MELTQFLEAIEKYYTAIMIGWRITGNESEPGGKLGFPQLLVRMISFATVAHNLLRIFGALICGKGTISGIQLAEAILWIGFESLYISVDSMFAGPAFRHISARSRATFDRILQRSRNEGLLHLRGMIEEAKRKCCCLFAFVTVLDTFEMLQVFRHLQSESTAETQPIILLPGMNEIVTNAWWFLQNLTVAVLVLCVSGITTLTALQALATDVYVRVLVEACSQTAGARNHHDPLFAILDEYRQLQLNSAHLNQEISFGHSFFYGAFLVQQGAQTYCAFRLLDQGAGWKDLQLLLADLLVSVARMFCSLHALCSVSSAVRSFRTNVTRVIATRRASGVYSRTRARLAGRVLSSLPNVSMELGGIPCDRDFTLTILGLILDIYITAALSR